MVIKNRKIASQLKHGAVGTASDFFHLINSSNYFKIDLTRHWDDTAITELYFHYNCIAKLGDYLRTQNSTELMEAEGSLPEIGGFLLGRYYKDPDSINFKVTVEEFIPVSPEVHDAYKLEFSTLSLANELGNAQDKFPELMLIAWFHTHPGHGLFLSSPDLAIHEGFFREKYQFAMEIDTLTNNLDTAFFTRTRFGKTNNSSNLKADAKWFDWILIEGASRMGQ